MQMHLSFLLLCLCPTLALGNDGDESLRTLLSQSEVVVLGKFTSEVVGETVEFGVVRYQGDFKITQLMAKTLSRFAKEPSGQAARRKPNVLVSLAGNWRLFLPAGFEYQATLTAEKGNRYRLTPGGLTFGASYEVQGDYLVSSPVDDSGQSGFKWKIQSPYLLTLVEQPARLGSDYLGAVFVRPSPAAELRLHEQASTGE